MPAFVSALKRVDLPTLGRPTMPHFSLMEGFRSGEPAILVGGARALLRRATVRRDAERRPDDQYVEMFRRHRGPSACRIRKACEEQAQAPGSHRSAAGLARIRTMAPRRGLFQAEDGMLRCGWCQASAAYRRYHDHEWGFPVTDD